MRETSFGKLETLFKNGNRPVIEYLEFEREGRSHKHKEYESFFVISGEGHIVNGEKKHDVKPGSLVTIAPMADHWMVPNEGHVLKGFLWYHDEEINWEQ